MPVRFMRGRELIGSKCVRRMAQAIYFDSQSMWNGKILASGNFLFLGPDLAHTGNFLPRGIYGRLMRQGVLKQHSNIFSPVTSCHWLGLCLIVRPTNNSENELRLYSYF
jgi:hypothetical protein